MYPFVLFWVIYCCAMKENMEWQVMFEACSFIQRITETYQFSGQLAKCLERREPCHYITVSDEN